MDTVVRYIVGEEPPYDVDVDVLYKGTRDKVLRWLEIAEAAPTATHVMTEDGELFGIEHYKE